MDDLFDILIQSGGKSQTPELPPQPSSFSVGCFQPLVGGLFHLVRLLNT